MRRRRLVRRRLPRRFDLMLQALDPLERVRLRHARGHDALDHRACKWEITELF